MWPISLLLDEEIQQESGKVFVVVLNALIPRKDPHDGIMREVKYPNFCMFDSCEQKKIPKVALFLKKYILTYSE